MKKHWLRGMLLGVSLALLLAGGVALAQGLFVRVDQECFECWGGGPNDIAPDDYVPHLDYGNWRTSGIDQVCEGVHGPSAPVFEHEVCFAPDESSDPCWTEFLVFCQGDWDGYDSCGLQEAALAAADEVENAYGQWVGWIDEYDGGKLVGHAEVTFLFAEDCAAAEFVPEPATILLLGSGLAGLAGYATLRLRSGQALRWRTRE